MRSLRKDILDRLLVILGDDEESALFEKWSEANFVDESVKFLLAVMKEKKRMIAEARVIYDRFCAEGAPLSLNPRDHRMLENRKQLSDRCMGPDFTMWDGIYHNIFRLIVDNDGLKCFKEYQKENVKKGGPEKSGGFLKLKFKISQTGHKRKDTTPNPTPILESPSEDACSSPDVSRPSNNASANNVSITNSRKSAGTAKTKEEKTTVSDVLQHVFQLGDGDPTSGVASKSSVSEDPTIYGLKVSDLVFRSLSSGVAWKWVTFALSAVPLSPLEIVDTLCAIYQSNSECQCQYALSLLYLLTSSILESIRKWVGDNILNVALVPDFSTKIETLNTYIMTKEPESHLLALHKTNVRTVDQMVKNRKRKHEIHKASQLSFLTPDEIRTIPPFIEMNPEVVARQMGYIEEQLWYELTPESLLSYIQALEQGKPVNKDSPVVLFRDHLNSVTEWVLDEILAQHELADRVKVLEKFILTCYEMRNLAGANAIGEAILSPAIASLKSTWAAMDLGAWNRVSTALARDNNFKSYRNLLRRNPRGYTTIPWLQVHLIDLLETYKESNPVVFSDGKINVKKLLILGKALSDLLIKKSYEVTPKKKIYTYLTQRTRSLPKKIPSEQERIKTATRLEIGEKESFESAKKGSEKETEKKSREKKTSYGAKGDSEKKSQRRKPSTAASTSPPENKASTKEKSTKK